MKAIHADPKEIRRIFSDEYIIPFFQRPYSWEKEHCDKLWDDLINFYEEKQSKDEKYFLGNIVIHPSAEAYSVIDGQQRLTTLLLLIKALYLKAGTVQALEKCLKKEDRLTAKLTDDLRLESKVLDADRESLHDIIFHNGANSEENHFKNNFLFFNNKLSDWWAVKGESTEALNGLILTLLDQVVLLPIHCGSEDDALTLFETINNRGMALNDADIFKAKLLSAPNIDRDAFVQQWNLLEDHEWLFRIHMHVLRAKKGDKGKEIALRKYFGEKKDLQDDWEYAINSIQLYHDVIHHWEAPAKITAYWSILETYPNYFWNFPLFIFLRKHGTYNSDGNFQINPENTQKFLELIEESVKFFFIKGVVHNSVNAVKDITFKVSEMVEGDSDYLSAFKKERAAEFDEFKRKLPALNYGRYSKGLVLISALLNPKQNVDNFCETISTDYHIEHILPRKWNDYDSWTSETWEKDLNKLGNLAPLEWRINISAQNEFFSRKKKKYLKSKIQDIVDLQAIPTWNPETLDERNELAIRRLENFFS